mmetsp:Transcript_4864/g.18225  ORF Transcript_4864/g.18225 Transcript_4864/m.18225 type:complete len:342 (-) Transcript_4864:561-1586(-)
MGVRKRYNIPVYKLQNYFRLAAKVTGTIGASMLVLIGVGLTREYHNAKNFKIDENKEVRIDCDPRAPKASFPSKYTPYATIKEAEEVNCDSSGAGVCMVNKVLIETNSHAGTHADQPKHFVENPPFKYFPDEYYNGDVLLLDLSPYLNSDTQQIDASMLEFAFEEINKMKFFQVELPWTSTVVNMLRNPGRIKRLIIKTHSGEHMENAQLDDPNSFVPHFSNSGASYLLQSFPELRMIGIDSISVDAPNAAPISEHVHGIFWRNQVAIVENLRLNNVNRRLVAGRIRTFWNPYQDFEDARGCIVTFAPAIDPMEKMSSGMHFDYVVRDDEFKALTQGKDEL